jgi:hypothetical protein
VSHPLAGAHSADESARLMRHYRYAAERMMRMLGGWIALTPELSAKLLMGRHVWENAQHADAFGKRLPELRAHGQASEPPNQAFADFMDAIETPEAPRQTVERLVGIYAVLKPHLLAAYREHLDRANLVYEPPTRRILIRCAEDERRHIAAGDVIIRHLAATAELRARAAAWRQRLEALLAAAGGVTGSGLPPLVPVSAGDLRVEPGDDAQTFIRLERSTGAWSIPRELESALKEFGDALVAGDLAALGRWLLPGSGLGDVLESALLAARFGSHRTVAFARIARHRVVKSRLEGTAGSMTVTSRWVPVEDGWRVAALDVSQVDPARPA